MSVKLNLTDVAWLDLGRNLGRHCSAFSTTKTGHVQNKNITLEKITFQPFNIFWSSLPQTAQKWFIFLNCIQKPHPCYNNNNIFIKYYIPGTVLNVSDALTHLIIRGTNILWEALLLSPLYMCENWYFPRRCI